ncbi:hypothetical protein AAII07_56115 [Microvirga sp. 0TCS3.31]
MPDPILTAIHALLDQVEHLTGENAEMRAVNQQNMLIFNENLAHFCERLDAIEANLEDLKKPIIVDGNGVVTNAAEALVSEFHALMDDTKKQVDELKSWFQVHLQDHDINGGRPMALTGAAFYGIVKNMEGPSL